jgi:hypothetical protein
MNMGKRERKMEKGTKNRWSLGTELSIGTDKGRRAGGLAL